MANDNLGKQGGKAASPTKQPAEGGVPSGEGSQSAPRGEKMNFEALKGFGGSGKGAH
jgi:hypothetical protein